MTGFDLEIVDKVKTKCRQGKISMDEEACSFVLGDALSNEGSEIAFQVGQIGTKMGYSPDIDVLEIRNNEAVGYEVKGVQGEKVSKDQLYKGLGQAQLLLSYPVDHREIDRSLSPRVRRSYLAYPRQEIEVSEEWESSFVERVEDISSVGLVDIRRDGFDIVVEAEPNSRNPQECADQSGVSREACLNLHGDRLRSLLQNHCTGKSVKNLNRSLEVLALRVADDYDISPVTLT